MGEVLVGHQCLIWEHGDDPDSFNPYHPKQVGTLIQWQSRLGLAEDSRTTDFGLGLLVPILIRMASSRQL